MRYAPERKLEKPQDREQGHISSTLETAPAQTPPSVGTKEKSRSPGAGIAIRPEKEIVAQSERIQTSRCLLCP